MTPPRTLTVLALGLAGMLTLTGCGSQSAGSASAVETEPPASVSSATAATPSGSATPTLDAEGLVIVVSIAGGKIRPLGKAYDAEVGETITLDVTSDTDDELHLHAEPEQTFAVTKGTRSFTFEVDVPGSVSLESHHLGGTIATIDVRP
ncbi:MULTISPECIES: hypothetical protein [Mumia]|uniref:hypothetical protein n=1 Tax=Mumia TaxID=1546255 RepID=UPI001422A9AF|nr:hypothetical protein [Mumia sp. ZJ1417]QMW66653.1 hypothetical protein H4N58_01350 [Mumia sp. ZJ1417]